MSSEWVPLGGAGLIGAALFVVGLIVLWPRGPRVVPTSISLGFETGGPPPSRLRRATTGMTRVATGVAERSGRAEPLRARLEAAGLTLEPGEWIVLELACVVSAGSLAMLLLGPIGAVIVGVCTAVGFRVTLTLKTARRRAKFAEQLGDTLLLISSSLRAGYGLLQALDSVAREADAPTSEEFARLIVETRLGRTASEALLAAADRVGNEDFDWVVEAITINREVGGELTGVLDRVGETIRERDRLRRQVRSLSAEGRLSAVFLIALPIVLFLYMQLTNPDYVGLMMRSTVGWLMFGTGIGLLVVGALWMRKLVQVEF